MIDFKKSLIQLQNNFLEDIRDCYQKLTVYFFSIIALILLFRVISPWLWSVHLIDVDVSQYMEWVLPWIHDNMDGIEFYFYSIFTFLVGVILFMIKPIIFDAKFGPVFLYISFVSLLLTMAAFKIPYRFPVIHSYSDLSWIPPIFVSGTFLLLVNFSYSSKINSLFILSLAFICLIQVFPFSLYNNSYYFHPAWQIVQGTPLSEASMLYDALFTVVAALIMKLKVDLTYFSVIQGMVNLLGIVLVFQTVKKIFNHPTALFTVILFVIFNYFAGYSDPTFIPQSSFWRIDGWYFVFLAILRWGPYNLKTIALIPLFAFLNANNGLLVSLSWVSFSFLILINKNESYRLRNFLITIFIGGLSYFAFSYYQNDMVINFVKLRVGFLKISDTTFVWFLLPLIWAPLLFKSGPKSKELCLLSVFATFLIPYFWGRSHENNLLRVSLPVIIISGYYISQLRSRNFVFSCLLFHAAYTYSAPLNKRIVERVSRILDGHFLYANNLDFTKKNKDNSLAESQRELKKFIDLNLEKKIITCFPMSNMEFYLHYAGYKDYARLPAKEFIPCSFLITKKTFESYRNKVKKTGYDLQAVGTNEF
jgi:hypothetical protein